MICLDGGRHVEVGCDGGRDVDGGHGDVEGSYGDVEGGGMTWWSSSRASAIVVLFDT